jgi:hypothetical protein
MIDGSCKELSKEAIDKIKEHIVAQKHSHSDQVSIALALGNYLGHPYGDITQKAFGIMITGGTRGFIAST